MKLFDILVACPQETDYLIVGTVAHRKPHDLRRRTSNNAQTKKVLVARDYHTAMLLRQPPYHVIRSPSNTEKTDMKGRWMQIGYCREHRFGKVFIQQQPPHRPSSGRNRQGPMLTFCRIGKTGQHIFVRELRKAGQDFRLRHATCQISQHFTDSESSATDAGFAETNGRINTDTVKGCHSGMIATSCSRRKT